MLKRYTKKSPRWFLMPKKKILPILLILAGLAIIFFVAFPIFSFKFFNSSRLERTFISPIGESGDFSRASNWFPSASSSSQKTIPVSSYFLSIPKLGIKEAVVSTANDELFKNLVHYAGSSLPGERGNAIVFGHSTLVQLFDPKNYKTIFSTLHALKKGDEIEVSVDSVTYRYLIFDIKIIDSQDISALEQQYDDSYLTLITCTPPGTYWKRLVIKGKLEKLELS